MKNKGGSRMAKSEYILPKPETVSMSLSAAEKLIASGRGDAALLYIYILRNNGHFSFEEASKELKFKKQLDSAMAELARLGLISTAYIKDISLETEDDENTYSIISEDKPEKTLQRRDAPPEYSVSDIKRRIDEGSDFKALVNEFQQRLGRVMSGGDLTILFGIYDYLGLPAEVIVILVGWCIDEKERKYGEGKRPSLREIEKEAYIWAHKELFTLESVEAYLKKKNQSKQKSEEIKSCLGIKGRPLSPTEEKYITAWLDMGFEADAIEEAYDRTILNKKELIWPYINRIIESWHKNGLHSIIEIKSGDIKAEQKGSRKEAEALPTEADYERMKKILDKLNGSGKNGA
jgi:DnaD/phage-associated family protein